MFRPSNIYSVKYIYIRHKEVQNSSYGGRWRECAPSSRHCRPALWTNQVLPPSTQKVSKKPSYFLTFNLRWKHSNACGNGKHCERIFTTSSLLYSLYWDIKLRWHPNPPPPPHPSLGGLCNQHSHYICSFYEVFFSLGIARAARNTDRLRKSSIYGLCQKS